MIITKDLEGLESVGLTKNESLVYTSLLKLGTSKTGDILKESKLNSGKIYEILESLKNKGLVSGSVINNVKNFSAANPKRLYDFINKKKEALDKEVSIVSSLIPSLQNLKKDDGKVNTKVFTGIDGLKAVAHEVLGSVKSGTTAYAMGLTGLKDERINRFWTDYFHPRRVEKSIPIKMLFVKGKTDYHKISKKMKLSQIKFSEVVMSPISIYGDKVFINNYEEPITTILIEGKGIADSFMRVFDYLWKSAK